MKNHIMIDLETMGTRYDAPILSIGACRFDPANFEEPGAADTLYVQVSPEDALKHGVLSGDTLRWWMEQGDDARRAAMAGARTLSDAMFRLRLFVERTHSEYGEPRVWGNGATFDITILEYAYAQAQTSIPWNFRAIRDCRTIAELAEGIAPRVKRPASSMAHNALDDAIYQARWTSAAWKALRPNEVG